ncbi:MAG: alpha/beta fold hydrolase [Pseudomonadota bacterium]
MYCKNFELTEEDVIVRGKTCWPSETQEMFRAWVILCHGIPGGTKDPYDPGYLQLAEVLCAAGYRCVVFNFRGAGESTGDFDLKGWAQDLKHVLDYAESLSPDSSGMVLFGFSAGAAVSVYTAAHDHRIVGLILAAGPADFDSILLNDGPDQFLRHARSIGIIKNPNFPFDQNAWIEGFQVLRPDKWISRIEASPILILHGDQDETVPVEHGYRLCENAPEPKELVVIKGGGHRLRLDDEAMKAALRWLQNTIT